MEKQFIKMGITARRIAAVDGPALSQDELAGFVSGYLVDERLTPAEIGCWLSHKTFWQTLVSTGTPYAAVFEDDVKFSSLLPRILTSDAWISSNQSCIKLDTSGINSFHTKPRAVDIPPFHLTKPMTGLLGTAGYIISRAAAERLLACDAHFQEPVDYYMFRHENKQTSALPYEQIQPAVAVQPLLYNGDPYLSRAAAQSTITESRMAAKKPMPFGFAKMRRELGRVFSPAGEPFRRAYYGAVFNASRYSVEFAD